MKLQKKRIHMKDERHRVTSQLALDEDYTVSDMRPQIQRLILERGDVKVSDIKLAKEQIWVQGILTFEVLYQTMEDQGFVSLKAEFPFQDMIHMEGITEDMNAEVKCHLEDLNLTRIHEHKIGVRALIQMEAVAPAQREIELTSGIETQEGEEIPYLLGECESAQLMDQHQDVCRIKKEIPLTSNRPNIQEILYQSVQLRNMEKIRRENGILLQGEALVFVLYEGEEEQLEWMESVVSIQGELECMERVENESFFVRITDQKADLEVQNDADGEARILVLELTLHAQIETYYLAKDAYVEDLYGVNSEWENIYATEQLPRILVKNHAKTKVQEKIQLKEPQQIRQICCCEGKAEVDHMEIRPERTMVEGTISMRILYLTEQLHQPLGVWKGCIPFQKELETPGIHAGCQMQITADIEQLNTVLKEENQVEIKAVIDQELMVFDEQQICQVKEAKEMELDLERLQKIPGIVGYIAQEGERLWDIAKEHHTTVEKLKAMNQLSQDILHRQEKILIVKSMADTLVNK